MTTILTGVGSPGTVGPASGGRVTAAVLGLVGQAVAPNNPQRQRITFHNPGTTNVFVYPTTNTAGQPNTPNNASPAGAFIIMPGGLIMFDGECQTAWGAFGASAVNFLTVLDTNV